MEANAPEFVIQKEIPIIQPVVTLSRVCDSNIFFEINFRYDQVLYTSKPLYNNIVFFWI